MTRAITHASRPTLVRLGVLVIALLLGLLPAASSAAAPGNATSGWVRAATSSIAGESLRFEALAIPARKDIWAIGYIFDIVGGAIEFRTLAEHLVGPRFEIVPTPDRETAPAADFLFGAAGTSASDIWAVGYSAPAGQPTTTLIEHWDGTAWSIATSPNPGANGDDLLAVTAISSSDVWAVGARQDAGHFYTTPLALHWNGGNWTAVAVPTPAACTGHASLTGVSGSATRLFATGWCGSSGNGADQAFIERWDGQNWRIVVPPAALPQGSELLGLSATASSKWATGFTQPPGNNPAVPLTLHNEAGKWKMVNVVDPSVSVLAGVSVSGAGTWAVGEGTSAAPPFAAPASAQFVKGAWQGLAVPVPYGSLAAVGSDPSTGNVWATGMSIGSGGYDTGLVVVHRPPS